MLIKGCGTLEIPVCYTEQLPDKLGETYGIKEALETVKASKFIKRTFSCFGNDAEEEWNNNDIKNLLTQSGRSDVSPGFRIFRFSDFFLRLFCVESRPTSA